MKFVSASQNQHPRSEPDWRYTRYPKTFAKGESSPQLHALDEPNKALWEKGDFTRIAETMRESGEALVQRLGITKGMKVLDLVGRPDSC